jgi:cytochrome c oxidase assembly protein subunit 15
MTTTTLPFPNLAPDRRRSVGLWLAVWAVMLVLIVVIGGITRLTESGLSITEWKPVTGILPPLSTSAWEEAFHEYQQIPEYQQFNRGMTLPQFKHIYFWEYLHRLWARLVGLAFAVPLVVFLVRGGLTPKLTRRLIALLLLTGAQGALGWFMVESGLSVRTDVSQYRLAAHLGLALVIYVATVWTAADLLGGQAGGRAGGRIIPLRRAAGVLTGLVFLTAIAGAFVAGLDAGRIYNTFPLMGRQLVPAGYLSLSPWWRNLFENAAAVQFDHRVLAMLSLLGAIGLWGWGLGAGLPSRALKILHLLPLAALIQVTLGITTLLLIVPVPVAALHQMGAVALLTVSLLLYHALRRSTDVVHVRGAHVASPAGK